MRTLLFLAAGCLLAACAYMKKEPPSLPPDAPPKPTLVKPAPVDAKLAPWLMLAQGQAPERDLIRPPYRYRRVLALMDVDHLYYMYYRPKETEKIVGFSITNYGSRHINPQGLKKHDGPQRRYSFQFSDRARENIYLEINDDVRISGRYSHDNMFREIHFFPRLRLPALEKIDQGGKLKVTLPTGEMVIFDARSKEIVSGVLEEEPVDTHPNRHQRHNPRVHYRGKYLIITVAQRGKDPRREKVWGRKKYAEVFYPAKYEKPCRISPAYIWDQRPNPGDRDPRLTMLHPSDASLFSMIERQCGWDLSELTLMTIAHGEKATAGAVSQETILESNIKGRGSIPPPQ